MLVVVVRSLSLLLSSLNYRFLKDSATTKLAPSADILEPQQNTKFFCSFNLASFDTDINRGGEYIGTAGASRFYA